MNEDTPMSGIGTTSAHDDGSRATKSASCPTCGQPAGGENKGLEQFLGKIGISEEMIDQLKTSVKDVDVDQYLTTAREYLSDGSRKATTYAKEHPGQVAAGVAAIAVGAGLLMSSMKRS